MTIETAREYHNDYTQPPVFQPAVRYMTRYWKSVRGSQNKWWDGMVFSTPEEATKWISDHRPGVPYVVIRVTTTELIVDTRAMHYEPDQPHYGVELRELDECPYTFSHTRDSCGYKTCRES